MRNSKSDFFREPTLEKCQFIKLKTWTFQSFSIFISIFRLALFIALEVLRLQCLFIFIFYVILILFMLIR